MLSKNSGLVMFEKTKRYTDNEKRMIMSKCNKHKGTNVDNKQCDQKKSPNVYKKLPKNDFTRKMKDFDTFTKIA